MSERHDEHGRTPEGESEGFIDRVKDFFGIRDDADERHDAEPEYAQEQPVVEGGDDVVREYDTDESDTDESDTDGYDTDGYDREELQKALDEAAADGQPNAESGDIDAPIGQESGGRAAPEGESGRGRDGSDDSVETERRTRHEVTRDTGDGDAPGRGHAPGRDGSDDSVESERRTRHEVTRETGGQTSESVEESQEAAVDSDADEADLDTETETETEEDRARREEEFAREHDPEKHDVAAGEEFRQPGDWTADEHGGPQVQDASGEVHDPGTPEAERIQQQAESAGDNASPGESAIEEVRDGGHGVGSAAPLPDGRQPFGHPVKAWTDTMTFVLPGEDGYDAAPHEWFTDGGAAERAGFRHAHGG